MPKKAKLLKLTDQIRSAVNDCDETRAQICQATGLDQATMSRFMSSERGLSMEALDAIAAHLELSIVSNRKLAKRKKAAKS